MRKIIFLLLTICHSFAVNAMSTYTNLNKDDKAQNTNCRTENYNIKKNTTYIGHIFYSEIREVGNITEEIAKQKCNRVYTNPQLSKRYRIELKLETPLEPKRFYYIDIGQGKRYYYLLYSDIDINDVDERINTTEIDRVICNKELDTDNDGIPDSKDNCPTKSNLNQSDIDNDGIGDVCDLQDDRDDDGDGTTNHYDKCPYELGPISNNGCPIQTNYIGHIFYSEIREVGNITKEIAKQNCNKVYTTQQLSRRYRIEIPLTEALEPKKFYYLDLGRGKNYYYLSSSNVDINDVDEELYSSYGIQKIECLDSDNDGTPDFKDNCPTQTGPSSNNGCPIKDSDNDGVPDSEDNCPNEAGSASNNGCPVSNEPAKIEIQKIVVNKVSDDKVVFNSEVNNSKLILNNNNDYSIEVKIKNVGGEIQKKIMWVIAESKDNRFDQFNDCTNTGGGTSEYSINLAPDEVRTKKREISIYNSIMGLCTVKQSGYLIVSINNDINYSIPYSYSSESSKSRSLATNSQTIKQKPYIIDVYNFKGQKVLSKEVKNTEEENKATLFIPKGVYIIKSKNGDRKIYID
ncbi:MAG: thrombospondin type 3 repeat-containing protein [Cellulophaga sp.]|uniref:thrombospondin type 3 repeat-containing protein n=1 Tax=unclassified Cellulophaga TaxID=2634405 RepID=UPI0026E3A1F5|nr:MULTISPECIES: thrombospondin type 3 repeat-containing protein [unclassified Cellulophaga]MDO6491744.1 thrombospondin type 3 repeat-containing protein [Cellulophaga sp. 2_MG-2023]MDO6495601.1 thrombospondin type 3 repeat-containing protein [Cellulophaga sp. 3_MG-2023]